MSTGKPVSLIEARHIADDFIRNISTLCNAVIVCGSVRREKATVNDIEIVAVPKSRFDLLNRTDQMLKVGTIRKANYGDARQRWGDTYRGMLFQGVLIELFLAKPETLGYIQWLRTGPGDKNTFVMKQMAKYQARVRFVSGAAWHVSYDEKHPAYDKRRGFALRGMLHVPHEHVLYALLGMPVIPPKKRDRIAYRPYLAKGVNTPSEDDLALMYVDRPRQQTMF